MKRAVISAKKHANLNYFKLLDSSEQFVNTSLENLENLDLNSSKSVINDCLISSINSATEETLLKRGKHNCSSHGMMISY